MTTSLRMAPVATDVDRSAPARSLGIGSTSRDWLIIGAIVGVGGLLRFMFGIGYAEEVDSVRFLLALDDFDVVAHRPHFPGYPVFVVLGKLFYWISGDPVLALSTLCALCGGLLPLPVAAFARSTLGARAGLWVGALVALNPLLWLYSTKLLSDMPGLLFLFSSLALLARGWQAGSDRLVRAGFLLLGLTMGVRLSYFPFVLSAMLVSWFGHKKLGSPVLFFLVGVLVWALPFMLYLGPESLVAIGIVQTTGHFTRWGGSVLTKNDGVVRAVALLWQVIAQGLGTWWSDRSWWYLIPTIGLAGFVGLSPAGTSRPQDQSRNFLLIWIVPYLIWIYLAQNITVKTRHSLPLLILVLLFIASQLARLVRRENLWTDRKQWAAKIAAFCAVLWLGGLMPSGISLAREHKEVPSNAVLLSKEVEQLCRRSRERGSAFVVYASSVQRHLERHAPCAEVVRTRRLSHARRELSSRTDEPVAYIVSDVPRVERLRRPPVRRWTRSRYIQNARNELSLYLLRGGAHER